MKYPRLALLTAGLLASVATGSADTIVSYLDNAFTSANITVTATGSSLAYSAADSNITASSLTDAINPATATDSDFSTGTGTFFAKANVVPSSPGTGTPWLTFNVQANTGYSLDLTALMFKFGGSTGSGTVTNYTPTYTVSYSLNNFATAGTQVGTGSATFSISTTNTTDLSYSANIDLSSIGGIASSETVAFRIALSDNSTSTNVSYRVDDLVLTGAVSAIPEPSVYAIIAGAFALGLVLVRPRA